MYYIGGAITKWVVVRATAYKFVEVEDTYEADSRRTNKQSPVRCTMSI